MSNLDIIPQGLFTLVLETESLTETCSLPSRLDWLVIKDPVSASLTLELQEHTTTLTFSLVLGIELSPHACVASSLLAGLRYLPSLKVLDSCLLDGLTSLIFFFIVVQL